MNATRAVSSAPLRLLVRSSGHRIPRCSTRGFLFSTSRSRLSHGSAEAPTSHSQPDFHSYPLNPQQTAPLPRNEPAPESSVVTASRPNSEPTYGQEATRQQHLLHRQEQQPQSPSPSSSVAPSATAEPAAPSSVAPSATVESASSSVAPSATAESASSSSVTPSATAGSTGSADRPSTATQAAGSKATTTRPSRLRTPRKAAMRLTPAAVTQLRSMLDSPDPKLIRVGVRNRGCSGLAYHLEYVDAPGRFDETVEQDGVKVLIDSKALFSIIGSEMDWVSDKLSERFVFRNPNIKEQCGCGESFMV